MYISFVYSFMEPFRSPAAPRVTRGPRPGGVLGPIIIIIIIIIIISSIIICVCVYTYIYIYIYIYI